MTNCQTTDMDIYDTVIQRLARWPPQRAPTQDMDVDVVDGLASIWSVIDDNPVALRQAGLFSTFPCNYQQVAQQLKYTEFMDVKMCTCIHKHKHTTPGLKFRVQIQ